MFGNDDLKTGVCLVRLVLYRFHCISWETAPGEPDIYMRSLTSFWILSNANFNVSALRKREIRKACETKKTLFKTCCTFQYVFIGFRFRCNDFKPLSETKFMTTKKEKKVSFVITALLYLMRHICRLFFLWNLK